MQRSRQRHATAPGDAQGHQRGFGGGRRAVVERSVADLLPGELRHHGLKLEHGLQRSLGDFRLVRGVGGKELAAREQGINHHGAIVRIGARAQQGNILAAALGRRLLEELQDFGFGERPGKVQFSFEPQIRWDLREEFIDMSVAGGPEHGLPVGGRVRQVAHQWAFSCWMYASYSSAVISLSISRRSASCTRISQASPWGSVLTISGLFWSLLLTEVTSPLTGE